LAPSLQRPLSVPIKKMCTLIIAETSPSYKDKAGLQSTTHMNLQA
jgi:hypothetical protein